MGGFEISAGLNADKAFLVNHSDLINRIDPYYYKGTFHNLRKWLIAKNFVRLSTFVDSWNRGDGPRDGFYTENSKLGVYFLRVNNLQKHTIELEDVKYINRIIHEKKLKRTQVTAGDVVFAISGTKDNLGTVSIIPNNIHEANLNSALVRFDLNKRIDKKFFCILFDLNFVRTQIEFTGKGAAQNNLNNDEISSFLLPNLDLSTQKSLVKNYEAAQQKQQQKQQQAQTLLNSIDTYLLNELGITLPEQDSSLEKRMFTVPFSEATGLRLDSQFYKTEFQKLIEVISSGKHFKLKDVAEFSTEVWNQSDYFNETFPYIEISEIELSTGEIVNVKQVSIVEAPSRAKMIVRQGDIIISLTRPTRGAIAHNQLPGINIASTGFAVIRTLKNNTVSKEMLFLLLKMSSTLRQMEQRATGGSYPAITQEELGNILLPCTEIPNQKKIVAHITQIRTQAKQLQTEAIQILNNAKTEIERMILGKV